MDSHICNVRCRNGEHVELIYANTEDEGAIAQCYAYYLGLRVIRVEPAREAMPLPDMPSDQVMPLTPSAWTAPSDQHRLLITYREDTR